MPCPICGGNCKDYTPSPGAGVTVTRLEGNKEQDNMKNVTLSKERWYVTEDKREAVREGDPKAAFLLVGKGGAIAPEVAEHYGIETYSGTSIERVANDPVKERERMAPHGTGNTTEKYEEMSINREVREQVKASLTTEGNRSAARQGEMMAQAIVSERKEAGTLVPDAPIPEPGQSRTKEIADPSNPNPRQGDTAATDPPPGGETTQTGQAPDDPLKTPITGEGGQV